MIRRWAVDVAHICETGGEVQGPTKPAAVFVGLFERLALGVVVREETGEHGGGASGANVRGVARRDSQLAHARVGGESDVSRCFTVRFPAYARVWPSLAHCTC